MKVLTTPRHDMGFCPGCSHGMVLEHLDAAIEKIGLNPMQVCLVSDIGCVGISDRYFSCHTFHGLHGRSVTYAEGIKRQRPDLTVVVVIGDGGCGIGTGHLVHAARRNACVTVLVCNNFNFGMTGGQHSPTTPPCGVTPTTPGGAIEQPFDVCATVAANGASYVCRCSAFDSECTHFIETALRQPAFALLDIWELCVAYYMPANKLKRPGLSEMADRLGMPFGVIVERERALPTPPAAPNAERGTPETKSEVRRAKSEGSPRDSLDERVRMCTTREPQALACEVVRTQGSGKIPHGSIESSPSNAVAPGGSLSWPGRTEICVAGSAGQRVQSAVGVIGEIAVRSCLFAAQQNDFPITVRKGHSISNLIIANEPILYTGVDRPDLFVILSDDGMQRLGGLGHLDDSVLILAAENVALAPTTARVERLNLSAMEKEAGKSSAALAILAVGLVTKGWVKGPALIAAAESFLTGKYRVENRRAIELAVRLQAVPQG